MMATALASAISLMDAGPVEPRYPAATASAFSRTNVRTETASSLQMDYCWRTARGAGLSASFTVPRAALTEAVRDFGYVPSELEADVLRLEASLRSQPRLSPMAKARKIVARSLLARFIEIRTGPDGEIAFAGSAAAEAPAGLEKEIGNLQACLDAEWRPCREEIRRRIREAIVGYLEKRGLVRMEAGIGVLYSDILRRFEPILRPLAEGIRHGGPGGRENDLEAILSFVQSIPSRPVPMVKEGRYVAGFSVPLEVLAEDSGDCDSKVVLFASIWRNLHKSPLALVRVPDHMLVGVAAPFGAGASVTFGSARFILCEVCPDGPAAPGAVSAHTADCIAQGRFKVTIIR